MNRRDLFKSLGALAVAAAVPSAFARDWATAGLIEGQEFLLHEPFVIRAGWPITIRDCVFRCAADFVGEAAVIFEPGVTDSLLERCLIDCKLADVRSGVKFCAAEVPDELYGYNYRVTNA